MSEDAAQYKASREDAAARSDTKEVYRHEGGFVAQPLLEQLRVNNGAVHVRLHNYPAERRWIAVISWAGRFDFDAIDEVSLLQAEGPSDIEAVNALAAALPAHREKVRAGIPDLIKRLRALAKVI